MNDGWIVSPLKCLVLLPLVLGCACSQAPKHFNPASTAVVHSRITDVKNKIDSASKEAVGLKADIAKARALGKDNKAIVLALDSANHRIDNLTKSLLEARTYATEADTKLTEADKKNQAMADQANKVQAKYNKIAPKYYRLKWALCLVAAGIAGFFIWKFKVPLLALGWIGIGIMIGAPIAVFGALWAFL